VDRSRTDTLRRIRRPAASSLRSDETPWAMFVRDLVLTISMQAVAS
jgi:hypothetical protein